MAEKNLVQREIFFTRDSFCMEITDDYYTYEEAKKIYEEYKQRRYEGLCKKKSRVKHG